MSIEPVVKLPHLACFLLFSVVQQLSQEFYIFFCCIHFLTSVIINEPIP